MKRFFSEKEKQIMFIMANGKCEQCGATLDKNWEADHKRPFSKGGRTTFKNGQALCQKCNRQKGAFALPEPRGWQINFLRAYQGQQNFLLVATPGAGKTMAGGFVANRQFTEGEIDYVIVVTPGVYLNEQWAVKTWKNFRISLDPDWNGRSIKKPYKGICVTYSKVANTTGFLDFICDRNRVLVILDEIHHAGDQLAWGAGIESAFENADYRLAMSGTPFRSDNNKIPFVDYENNESVANFSYGYGNALKDGVCRSVGFRGLNALVTWTDYGTGKKFENISFDDELRVNDIARRLNVALKPGNEYLKEALREADDHLNTIRQEEDPRAGGLIVTIDTEHAEGIAQVMREITGEAPVVVHSEIEREKGKARALIDRYAKSRDKWIVAVQMVSEGVDIPRLRIGVYATTITTELTFRQIIGRIIRRQGELDAWAFFYVPKDPRLVSLMEAIKEERTHVLHDLDDDKTGNATTDRLQAALPLWFGLAERYQPGDVMIADGETFEDGFVRKAKEVRDRRGIKLNDEELCLFIGDLVDEWGPPQAQSARPAVNGNEAPHLKRRKMGPQCTALANHVAGRWVEKCNRPFGEVITKLHAASKRRFGKPQDQMSAEELQKKMEWLNSIKDKPWTVL